MLAHELRNPLAPIRVRRGAPAREATPTPERLEWARDVIDRQVDQLTRLVDDLLDVSRITRGKVSLQPRAGRARRGPGARGRDGAAADRGAQAGPDDHAGRANACA